MAQQTRYCVDSANRNIPTGTHDGPDTEMLSALLALCEETPQGTGGTG